jgi:hypothetical protein
MIRVIDRTLSCLGDMPQDTSALKRLLALLIQTEPDAIEISAQIAEMLIPLPCYPFYCELKTERT